VVSDIHRPIPEGIFRIVSSTRWDFNGFQDRYPRIPVLKSVSFPCGKSWLRSIPLPKEWFDPLTGGPADLLQQSFGIVPRNDPGGSHPKIGDDLSRLISSIPKD
jgi:hypothetical protein